MENKKTVAEIAEKYGAKPACVVALEQRVLDLEKQVENLNNALDGVLRIHIHADPYDSPNFRNYCQIYDDFGGDR